MLIKRLKEFLEYKSISVFAFEKSIGLANNSIRKKITSGRSNMGTETLTAILEAYPELSSDWLILGVGDMLRVDNNKQGLQNKDTQESELTEALQIIKKQQDTIIELTKTLTALVEKNKI